MGEEGDEMMKNEEERIKVLLCVIEHFSFFLYPRQLARDSFFASESIVVIISILLIVVMHGEWKEKYPCQGNHIFEMGIPLVARPSFCSSNCYCYRFVALPGLPLLVFVLASPPRPACP